VAAGSFIANTKAEADALAAAYVTDYMNAGLASGELMCGGECPEGEPATWWETDNTLVATAVTVTPNDTPFDPPDANPFNTTTWPQVAVLDIGGYALRYKEGALKQRNGPYDICFGPTGLEPDWICAPFGPDDYTWTWAYTMDGPSPSGVYVSFQNGRGNVTGTVNPCGVYGTDFTYADLFNRYFGCQGAEIFHGGGRVAKGNRLGYDPAAPLANELHSIPPTIDIVRVRRFFIVAPLPVVIQDWAAVAVAITNTPSEVLNNSALPAFTGVFRYGKINVTAGVPVSYTIDDALNFTYSVNGKQLFNASIVFDPTSGCRWTMLFVGRTAAGNVTLWEGFRNSLDSRGVYTRISGAALGPATITI
jgi:hypothetical protein